ncbi:autotransporter domain-containing protein [Parasulfuritortus cantonensis]|uniref:Autotransporter domain-containing protein n=1 Tax=Parasulfuritortus cantonensis TaxID=2528202 RepID=A0A4R1BIZ1_9PROT|nr:autotransporter domain-containing protein [Parasulfuritortus cantonensis]TCJ17138.1 autotransporter domain-containing protein [Parasulfuritortus cantonensis]
MSRFRSSPSPIVLAIALAFSPVAHALDSHWTGATGDWFDAGNWDNGVPTGLDSATIGNAGTAQVPDGTAAEAQYLTVGGSGTLEIVGAGTLATSYGVTLGSASSDDGTIRVTGAGASWSNGGSFFVGLYGTGTLTVDGGGTLENTNPSQHAYVGYGAGSSGTVNVDGVGSTWDNVADIYLGRDGSGTLNVSNGGQVTSAYGTLAQRTGSTGSATITGSGSGWSVASGLYVGSASNGELDILDGGAVSASWGYLGNQADSYGALTVSGPGSTWTDTNGLYVGFQGEGVLAVEDGASANGKNGFIGYESTGVGTATVTGADSTWTNSNWLAVGMYGNGTLRVEAGGRAESYLGYIAYEAGSTGAAIVSGSGSTWASDYLYVGWGSSGTLTVENGGTVTGLYGYVGRTGGDGTALVTGSGSSWAIVNQLEVGSYGTGALTIADGATVSDTDGIVGNQAGVTGTVRVDGGTWSNSGFLRVGNLGTGTLDIVNGGVVTSGRTLIGLFGDGVGSVDISGAGSLLDTGGNELYVASDGTATLTVAAGGELRSGTAYIGSNSGSQGEVSVLGSGSSWTNAGALYVGLDGTGTLTVGSGAEVSSGSAYVHGLLSVDGLFSAATTSVRSGGTVAGTGTLAGDLGLAGGTLAPGNSIGTLTVAGNLDFDADSVYAVEVDAAGNSDLTVVTGTASLAGTVHVLPEPGSYQDATQYTILSAAALSSSFDATTIDADFAFLTPSLSQDTGNVYLTLVRNDVSYAEAGDSPNQQSVGDVLDQLADSDPAAVSDILDNLNVLDNDAVGYALDRLSGVQLGFFSGFGSGQGWRFLSLILDRLSSDHGPWRSADAEPVRVASASDASLRGLLAGAPAAPERGLWVKVFGSHAEIDATADAYGADSDTRGFLLGGDRRFDGDLRAGLAVGYAGSDVDSTGSRLDMDSYQLAAYLSWTPADYYLDASVGYGWHAADSRRSVVVGSYAETASADYDGNSLALGVEAGRLYKWGRNGTVAPFVGLGYNRFERDGFTEHGGGQADLAVAGSTDESVRSSLGLQFGYAYRSDGGTGVWSSLRAAWLHEFADTASRVTAGFAAAPDLTFSVAGPALDRDRLQVSADVKLALSRRDWLSFAYTGEFAGSDHGHGLTFTYRREW